MDKIINNTSGINLLINEEFLEFININSSLVIDLNEYMTIYTNNTSINGFELKAYNEYMPVYTIVLNFMFETGGVF